MFDRFSYSTRRVVFWSRLEAGRSGADQIEPEHLLLGFLLEDQDWQELMVSRFGAAWAGAAQDQGGRPEPFLSREVAEKLRDTIWQSNPPVVDKPPAGDILVAKPSRTALEAAKKCAGNSTVGTLHILWGLMTKGGNSVRDLLRSNGVTVRQIEQAIQGRT